VVSHDAPLQDVLDQLTIIIKIMRDAKDRHQVLEDREALDRQMQALSRYWSKLEELGTRARTPEVTETAASLGSIAATLAQERERLETTAAFLHQAAEALGLVERLARKLTDV